MPARRRYQPYTPPGVEAVYRPARKSPVSQAIADAGEFDPDGYVFPPHPLPGGPDGQVVMVFTAPDKVIGLNSSHGRHYGTDAMNRRLWRAAGADVAREYADQLAPYRGHRVELTFCLPLRNATQADAMNGAAGPSGKALQDGITDTGLLVPKDTVEWVRTDCVFWTGGESRDQVRVRVRIAEPPWCPTD